MKQQDYLEIIELNKGKHHPPLETLILGRKLSSDKKKDSHDYSEDYLTFVALEDGTISFNIWKSMGTDLITSISYSTDNGETWTTTANQNNKQENLVIDVNVNEGDKVLWKGIAAQIGCYDENIDEFFGSFFSSTCEFDAKGNVMSLLYGDDFKGETTIERDGTFCRLFYDYDKEKTCSVVNAKDLSLPATTLAVGCYRSMFSNCTSLITAPELPAITLANYCYYGMFNKCVSLKKAPKLPATTLAENCYSGMFNKCTSLTTVPELPATTLAQSCYGNMFQSCTSLTTAPELPATTLASSCYINMFWGCTSLTSAPELPATTLASNCYEYMFSGCTNLTTAPSVLPATTLADNCYHSMFYQCKNLTVAPELPATTLATYCYSYMFRGCTLLTTVPNLPATDLTGGDYCYCGMFYECPSITVVPKLPATTLSPHCYHFMFAYSSNITTVTELPATDLVGGDYCYDRMFRSCSKLNYVKAMFLTDPMPDRTTKLYTDNWLYGVSSTGTFVKNVNATWTERSEFGIPKNWTVETASE